MTTIKFTTKQPDTSNENEILLTRATRASTKGGKEQAAAFEPRFGVVQIPELVQTLESEFLKLAALAGLKEAYKRLIAEKLPVDLLKSDGGAEQQISITDEELVQVLRGTESSARLTKELINAAWSAVQASALHKLLKLKDVRAEKDLPDNVRRQFSAQMLKRAEFCLSLASTTGVKLHSEDALTSALPWLIAATEQQQASEHGWIFTSMLEKVTGEIQRREDARNAAAAETDEDDESLDLDALF